MPKYTTIVTFESDEHLEPDEIREVTNNAFDALLRAERDGLIGTEMIGVAPIQITALAFAGGS